MESLDAGMGEFGWKKTRIPLPAHWEGLSLAWTSVEINRVLGGEIN